ncbi:MAG: hypothetical protein GTN78_05460 [Gemmatimonadales bacterium]|nr:hypothetical protein [Gemmatimonadales bacterium]NIN13482.1 hypothetical protein [Gemmatimonadales bacterium]NIQ99634.1 hypothetical protein [Gemmatimonadales bacterium]NIS64191.1 hypothetical protein [Gemmatimonadales bacterium]
MLQRALLLVATVLLVGASAAGAQTVKGIVRQSDTSAPMGGTYVVLLDPDSLEVTRALTNPLGEFNITAPRPGSYRVRTEQIGYRSVVSSLFTLSEEKVTELELLVQPVIVRLDAITIRGEARECRVVEEQALEVLAVWDEARKVLQAVAWSDLQGHLVHELERFERWYSFTFRLLHEARSTTPTRHVLPFRSRSVEELEELGYVLLEGDSVVYEAPDAEVFFSDLFLQHHCFSLDEANWDGRRMVGLRFEPVRGRALPDVKGVFWLDRATAALERLELGYVNVGMWQRERGASGELEFARLPDGRWFVSRWWILMPLVRRVETMKGPVWDLRDAVVGFEEEGGEVRRVYAPDGRTLYARGRATVRGVIFDSTSGRGLADAYVRLAGTRSVTISEADGSYWLTDLPEGRYTVTFTHPRATLLGLADEGEVDLEVGVVARVNLALPSPRTIVERVCPEPATAAEEGLLVGRVYDTARDTVMVGARVRVVWLEGGTPTDRLRWVEVETDSEGIYRACVPRSAALSVEVRVGGEPLAAAPAVFGESRLRILDVEVRRPEGR